MFIKRIHAVYVLKKSRDAWNIMKSDDKNKDGRVGGKGIDNEP